MYIPPPLNDFWLYEFFCNLFYMQSNVRLKSFIKKMHRKSQNPGAQLANFVGGGEAPPQNFLEKSVWNYAFLEL